VCVLVLVATYTCPTQPSVKACIWDSAFTNWHKPLRLCRRFRDCEGLLSSSTCSSSDPVLDALPTFLVGSTATRSFNVINTARLSTFGRNCSAVLREMLSRKFLKYRLWRQRRQTHEKKAQNFYLQHCECTNNRPALCENEPQFVKALCVVVGQPLQHCPKNRTKTRNTMHQHRHLQDVA